MHQASLKKGQILAALAGVVAAVVATTVAATVTAAVATIVAAAGAATASTGSVAAATAADDQDKDDDPPAVKSIVPRVTHNKFLLFKISFPYYWADKQLVQHSSKKITLSAKERVISLSVKTVS